MENTKTLEIAKDLLVIALQHNAIGFEHPNIDGAEEENVKKICDTYKTIFDFVNQCGSEKPSSKYETEGLKEI
jgi:hypothetical protein